MIAEVSVADSSSGPAVSCAAVCVGTAAITASSASPHGIKPAIITNAKVRMKLFISVTTDSSIQFSSRIVLRHDHPVTVEILRRGRSPRLRYKVAGSTAKPGQLQF